MDYISSLGRVAFHDLPCDGEGHGTPGDPFVCQYSKYKLIFFSIIIKFHKRSLDISKKRYFSNNEIPKRTFDLNKIFQINLLILKFLSLSLFKIATLVRTFYWKCF